MDFDDVFGETGWQTLPQFHDLKGKSVFITGGGSGIGAFLTAGFALLGANVGFISLTKEPADRLCDAIAEKTGNRPFAFQGDIRSVDVLREAIAAVSEANGSPDVLVNNAARDTRHTLQNWSVDEWDDSIATNLRPSFFTAQAVAEEMRRKQAGSIINIGSNSFNLGLAGYPTYVTAKGGLVGMTKALARELGPDGIRVNIVVPGWVMTERQKRLWVTEEDLQSCLNAQSMKTTLNGWDIVGTVLFLASDAARMLTGQEIIVDGGRV